MPVRQEFSQSSALSTYQSQRRGLSIQKYQIDKFYLIVLYIGLYLAARSTS
ncbi:hypothetical protein PM082_021770 [Marasmius tenuissimus]|nr:hypothetical protein PM082_021770 [Marasmius tenuissimus]